MSNRIINLMDFDNSEAFSFKNISNMDSDVDDYFSEDGHLSSNFQYSNMQDFNLTDVLYNSRPNSSELSPHSHHPEIFSPFSYIPPQQNHQEFKPEPLQIEASLPEQGGSLSPAEKNVKKNLVPPCESPQNPVAGWSEEDDLNLLKLTKKYKSCWDRIAKDFLPRKFTITYLKKQYGKISSAQNLFPRRVKFNENEDLLIVDGYLKHETDWATISARLVNRTPEMVKNRFYNHIKKKNLYNDLVRRVNEGEANSINLESLEQSQESDSTEKNENEEIQAEEKVASPEINLARLNEFLKTQNQIIALIQKENSEMKSDSSRFDKLELQACIQSVEMVMAKNYEMLETLKNKLKN